MKYRSIFFGISLMFLIPGVVSLLLFGLKPAIDFTGGSLLEVEFRQVVDGENWPVGLDQINQVIADTYQVDSLQNSGDQQLILRGKEISNQEKDQILLELEQIWGEVEALRFETVGPTLGRELLTKTLTAVVIVSGMITAYVAWRFSQLKYGVSAVLAMFHDSLILLGAFSLLGHFYSVEVDVLFVTALLTTLSFSIHDTIVVYDRIREKKKKVVGASIQNVINAAVIETLGRSINNSITIILMLAALALLGGDSIRWFAVALLIGAITGTYSSTFTAAPLLLLWDDLKKMSASSVRHRKHQNQKK